MRSEILGINELSYNDFKNVNNKRGEFQKNCPNL